MSDHLHPFLAQLRALGMSVEYGQYFLNSAQTIALSAGEFLIVPGENSASINFVLEGYLRMYGVDASNKRWTRYLAQPGSFIASMSTFLYGEPNEEYAQCITDTTVLTVRKQDLGELLDRPAVRVQLQEATIRLLVAIARERSELLPMNAKERYLYFLKKYPGLIENVPLGDIASYIGIRQQSLSRIRREFRT